jgi:PUA-like domain
MTSFVQAINELPTDFLDFDRTVPPKRVSMSVPIVLPCTAYTKNAIETSGKKAVALVNKHGQTMAILRNPEIYVNRKEEIVARIFGVIDPGHPYISHIYKGGDWLIGGEIELLDRIRYNDGLDQWRLTAPEVMREFEAKNTDAVFAFQVRICAIPRPLYIDLSRPLSSPYLIDAVFAFQVSTCVDVWVDVCFLFRRSTYLFPSLALPHLSLCLKRTRLRLHQTRNPTHAGHAYLMRTAREILLKKGYSNPVSTHT